MDYDDEQVSFRTPLPTSAEEAEDLLINKAINLAMKRLEDETASNGLIAEIIKLGTAKERLQKEKLKKENEFYSRVLDALHSYAPSIYNPDAGDDDDEYEY